MTSTAYDLFPWDKVFPCAYNLPRIRLDDQQYRDVIAACYQALLAANNPPKLFHRGGRMVRIRLNEHDRPFIEMVNADILLVYLTDAADFYRCTGKNGVEKEKAAQPSQYIVKGLLSLKDLRGLPPLKAIIQAPCIRPDGTIILTPGYDEATQLYYHPGQDLETLQIPDMPTKYDVNEAVKDLLDLLQDFPFKDEFSLANAIALIITQFLRPAIDGSIPLALIDATKAGSGKTLLIDLVMSIVTGQKAEVSTAPNEDEEWRKRITSEVMSGSTFISIDNVTERLDSSKLAAALTSQTWRDRILGRTDMVSLPMEAIFAANGNNIRLGGDIPRRVYWICLDPKTSRPFQRKGFAHPEVAKYAMENRALLVSSVLTIIRSWFSENCPSTNPPTFGSFQSWTRMVHGILSFAGIPGFLGNMDRMLEERDDEEPVMELFLLKLHTIFGDEPFTARQVVDAPISEQSNQEFMDLAPACIVVDDRGRELDMVGKAKAVGRLFSRIEGTRFGESQVYVQKAREDKHNKRNLWRVCR